MTDLAAWLADAAETVEAELRRRFPRPHDWPVALYDAAAWALFGGGKRIRPALCLAACEAVRGRPDAALPAACAVEMVHTYSLIHDDLPCMDDDDERRGRPTVHVRFGEALALLAGDALLTEAFAVVAGRDGYPNGVPDTWIAATVVALAEAAGWRGMVGGQSLELGFEQPVTDEAALVRLHRLKTGALFRFAAWSGAALGGAGDAVAETLGEYGETLGLAFQIADDLLDLAQDRTARGIDAGGTPSFPALLGEAASRERARALAGRCADLVAPLGAPASRLGDLAWFAVERRS